MKSLLQLSLILLIAFGMSGCSSLGKSLRDFISGNKDDQQPKSYSGGPTKYSDNDNVASKSDRQYKRMNRQKFEDESDLKEDAGSLWVMEGQGAYLFSQNQMRMIGDLLNVKIDGGPKNQLQTKVKVISKLLERLESPLRGLASQQAAAGAPPAAAEKPAEPAAGEAAAGGAAKPADAGPAFAVQVVPTRIVEQLKDGSYRVRGMQPFMIGKREYKVIVTGLVRPEDFDDAGIEAAKLLDSQFDIVSSRKGASM